MSGRIAQFLALVLVGLGQLRLVVEEVGQGTAAVEVVVPGVQFDGPGEVGDGQVVLADFVVGDAPVEEGIGQGIIQGYGLGVIGDGTVIDPRSGCNGCPAG